LEPISKSGKKNCKACVCSKTIRSKTSWDSIKDGKKSRGGEGNKGDYEGSVVKLCNYGWHIHPNGGENEECSNLSWGGINYNIG
jgi:hypothetical protein